MADGEYVAMPVKYYPAVIERGTDIYGVFFPDLPGCTSAGTTIADAAAHAEEALNGHLRLLAEDGHSIPDPTPLEQLAAQDCDEAARLLVRAELPGRSVRVNVTFDEGLLAAADAAAGRRGQSRSGFLADAVRQALRDRAA